MGGIKILKTLIKFNTYKDNENREIIDYIMIFLGAIYK